MKVKLRTFVNSYWNGLINCKYELWWTENWHSPDISGAMFGMATVGLWWAVGSGDVQRNSIGDFVLMYLMLRKIDFELEKIREHDSQVLHCLVSDLEMILISQITIWSDNCYMNYIISQALILLGLNLLWQFICHFFTCPLLGSI